MKTRQQQIRGARASRAWVSASRRNHLPEKLAIAGRNRQHARRVRSPEIFCLTIFTLLVAGCAEAKTKSATPARSTSSSSTKFEGIGRVSYHRGQPCAAPIMFDMDVGFGETVELAAGFKDEKLLADAIKHRRRVRVFGNWKRGKEAKCRYVAVTKIDH
jgi:hypothetical protein